MLDGPSRPAGEQAAPSGGRVLKRLLALLEPELIAGVVLLGDSRRGLKLFIPRLEVAGKVGKLPNRSLPRLEPWSDIGLLGAPHLLLKRQGFIGSLLLERCGIICGTDLCACGFPSGMGLKRCPANAPCGARYPQSDC